MRRLKENVGFIANRVTAIQASLDSWQAEQINRKLYYISFLSIVFLPLSVITGGKALIPIQHFNYKKAFILQFWNCAMLNVWLQFLEWMWEEFHGQCRGVLMSKMASEMSCCFVWLLSWQCFFASLSHPFIPVSILGGTGRLLKEAGLSTESHSWNETLMAYFKIKEVTFGFEMNSNPISKQKRKNKSPFLTAFFHLSAIQHCNYLEDIIYGRE